jgi:hypothetical protein
MLFSMPRGPTFWHTNDNPQEARNPRPQWKRLSNAREFPSKRRLQAKERTKRDVDKVTPSGERLSPIAIAVPLQTNWSDRNLAVVLVKAKSRTLFARSPRAKVFSSAGSTDGPRERWQS